MLLPQSSVASVLNPRISGGAQMTEGWEERAGRELDITESIEKETNERERERERK